MEEVIEVVLTVAFEGCPGSWQKLKSGSAHSALRHEVTEEVFVWQQEAMAVPGVQDWLVVKVPLHFPLYTYIYSCLGTGQILAKTSLPKGGPVFSLHSLFCYSFGYTTFPPPCLHFQVLGTQTLYCFLYFPLRKPIFQKDAENLSYLCFKDSPQGKRSQNFFSRNKSFI